MSDEMGSALLRRIIGRRLAGLRKARGLTHEQAAQAIQKGRSTIARIEEGRDGVRLRELDVRALLDLYGASAEDSTLLLALTGETWNGRKKSWWHDYTETTMPAFFGLYVSLEDSAERIKAYEVELVPGLLQTRAYAAQVHRVPEGYVDEDESQRRVEVRMARQSLLTRPRAPRLEVILNEAALQRMVGIGGHGVAAEQAQRLIDASQQANISIRVVPFAHGLHGGMAASTPFTLLDFPRDPHSGEELEPTLAYVDTLTGALYLQKPNEVSAYMLTWEDLDRGALNEDDSRKKVLSLLEGLRDA